MLNNGDINCTYFTNGFYPHTIGLLLVSDKIDLAHFVEGSGRLQTIHGAFASFQIKVATLGNHPVTESMTIGKADNVAQSRAAGVYLLKK